MREIFVDFKTNRKSLISNFSKCSRCNCSNNCNRCAYGNKNSKLRLLNLVEFVFFDQSMKSLMYGAMCSLQNLKRRKILISKWITHLVFYHFFDWGKSIMIYVIAIYFVFSHRTATLIQINNPQKVIKSRFQNLEIFIYVFAYYFFLSRLVFLIL